MKKLNRKTEKEKARKAFKRFIRLRDCLSTCGTVQYGQCFTCDQMHMFVDLDAGHYTQGSHDSTYFLEANVHAQCTKCNRFSHGNLSTYTLRMIDQYGRGLVEELHQLNHTTVKMKAQDFHDIYVKYTEKCKELEDRGSI